MARRRPGKLRCGCSPRCARCSAAASALGAVLRGALAAERAAQASKAAAYRECRALGLPESELRRRSGADSTPWLLAGRPARGTRRRSLPIGCEPAEPCGCAPRCARCSAAMRALAASLRAALAAELAAQREKSGAYREGRALGLPARELRDLARGSPPRPPRGSVER